MKALRLAFDLLAIAGWMILLALWEYWIKF